MWLFWCLNHLFFLYCFVFISILGEVNHPHSIILSLPRCTLRMLCSGCEQIQTDFLVFSSCTLFVPMFTFFSFRWLVKSWILWLEANNPVKVEKEHNMVALFSHICAVGKEQLPGHRNYQHFHLCSTLKICWEKYLKNISSVWSDIESSPMFEW